MTGILGSANLLNGPLQAFYVNNRSNATVVTVNVCNRNTSRPALVRLAVSASTTPLDTEWIEFDVEIPARGVLERSGVWVNSAQYLIARSNMPDVNVVTWGVTKGSTVTVPSLPIPTIGTVSWSTGGALGSAPRNTAFRRDLLAIESNGGTIFYSVITWQEMPPGIGLSNTGVLGGSPTTAGSYTFTVNASNGTNSVNRAFTLTIT